MPTPESQRKLTSREELETALNEAADGKIKELKKRYGDVAELKNILESTIDRIETEKENFHRVEMNKILRYGNTFEDVYEIYTNRINLHCLDIRNAADDLNLEEPQSGIHTVRKIVKADVKKVA